MLFYMIWAYCKHCKKLTYQYKHKEYNTCEMCGNNNSKLINKFKKNG